MRANQARASRKLLKTLTGRSPWVAAKARANSPLSGLIRNATGPRFVSGPAAQRCDSLELLGAHLRVRGGDIELGELGDLGLEELLRRTHDLVGHQLATRDDGHATMQPRNFHVDRHTIELLSTAG